MVDLVVVTVTVPDHLPSSDQSVTSNVKWPAEAHRARDRMSIGAVARTFTPAAELMAASLRSPNRSAPCTATLSLRLACFVRL